MRAELPSPNVYKSGGTEGVHILNSSSVLVYFSRAKLADN